MLDTAPRTARIRELNDAFRTTFQGGRVMLTSGLSALEDNANALRAICRRLPSFEKRFDWVNTRMNEFLELAEMRHTIVHGYFHGIARIEAEPIIYFRRAPPLYGLPGDRLIATRQELEAKLKILQRIDSDLAIMILFISQEVKKEKLKAASADS